MSGNYYYMNNYPPPLPPARQDWSVPPPNVAHYYNHAAGYESNAQSVPASFVNSSQSSRQGYFPQQGSRPNKNSHGRSNSGRRYNNSYGSPTTSGHYQHNWNRNQNYNSGNNKRANESSIGEKVKPPKKKKKPALPARPKCTVEEAQAALDLEKDYNKRHKNQSLIIKFPDLELNKDIVSQFHSAIGNVHFQQPSTARFCFVTLKDTSDPEDVISALNKIKFGDGYLKAEYKRDKEDQQSIGAGDIDPFTLYVGNLSKDITKEDMVKAYPKYKRIDIGYAQRMKFTRYAFVVFGTVEDSMEAFKNTYSTQMYSKSLIVRFKRTNGSVGTPGEPKPQSSRKDSESSCSNVKISETSTPEGQEVDLSLLKKEPIDSEEGNSPKELHSIDSTRTEEGSVSNFEDVDNKMPKINGILNGVEIKKETTIKTEEYDYDDDYNDDYIERSYYNDSDSEEEAEATTESFTSMYNRMVERVINVGSISKGD